MHVSLAYLAGDEASEVLGLIDEFGESSPRVWDVIMEYVPDSVWDVPDIGSPCPPWGQGDYTHRNGDLVLCWNHGHGYWGISAFLPTLDRPYEQWRQDPAARDGFLKARREALASLGLAV